MSGFFTRIRPMRAVIGLAVLILLVLAVIPLGKNLCERALRGAHVPILEEDLIAGGYVLMPVSLPAPGNADAGEVRLVAASGAVVHAWKTEHQPFMAYLQDNGDIVVAMVSPTLPPERYPDGTTGILARLDWDGNVLWTYEDPKMDHDFDVLPDGSIAYLRWDKVPPEKQYRVSGGFPTGSDTLWSNEIVLLDPGRNITWTWKADEHLSELPRVIHDVTPDFDWTHMNSLRYVATNPVTGTPAFLVSIRNVSVVAFIDTVTGAVIWHSPEGAFSLQHDATLLENGNILVFDNGALDKAKLYLTRSEAVQMDVATGEKVWRYDGGTTVFEKLLFSSSITSGAARLPNGNTLITLSMQGRIYEVTEDGRIAWEYVSDFRNEEGEAGSVFKARKYDPRGTMWGSRLPITAPLAGFFCGPT